MSLFFFLIRRRWPLKWHLVLLLLNYRACFLPCYLVHLPASYLARRYVSVVWQSLISSVACSPSPASSFSMKLSFVVMFPDRRNILLEILVLNWNSSCKFSGFTTHQALPAIHLPVSSQCFGQYLIRWMLLHEKQGTSDITQALPF